MSKEVSLKSLVNRIEMDEKLLKSHPERKCHLEKHIAKTKEEIVECVLNNSENILLERIMF